MTRPTTPTTLEPVRVVTVDSRVHTHTSDVEAILADLEGELASAMWELLVQALTSGRGEEDADNHPRRTFFVEAGDRAAAAQQLREAGARLVDEDASLTQDDLPEPPCGLAAFVGTPSPPQVHGDSAVTRLYSVAKDAEVAVLDALLRRAGLVWECYGRTGDGSCWTNAAACATCEHCGAPRELGSVEDHLRPERPVELLSGESALAAATSEQRSALDALASSQGDIGHVALVTDGNLVASPHGADGPSLPLVVAPDGHQVHRDSE